MSEQNEGHEVWEGADDLEQDLQNKIKSDMENQEPKIERKLIRAMESENERWNTAEKLATMLQFAKDSAESFRENGSADDLEEFLQELKKAEGFASDVLNELKNK